MGLAVVTVASGGLPVVESTAGGTPVTEAANGRGIAVTKVVGKPGLPVVFETIGGGSSDPVAAFLARTSGLDGAHTAAYTALINGLVLDGVWSKLDVVHIYATQDSTTAKLNLVQTSYGATTNGSPVFTPDRGFSGIEASTTVYIDTGFNANTGIPKFVLNSAHVSGWVLNNVVTTDNSPLGVQEFGTKTVFTPRYSDSKGYFYINNPDAGRAILASSSDSRGHWITNRSGSSAMQVYKNGSSVATGGASNTILNRNFYVLAHNNAGTANGSGAQLAMVSIGSSLTSGEATGFYNRLRTYMTAVGVP